MAIMENLLTGEKVFLKSHHVFGRNKEKSDTYLAHKEISQIHASIRWDGWEWLANDHSRNGVWIDGIRLVPGKNTGLKQGSVIRFSSGDVSSWKMIDHTPPTTVLIPLPEYGPVIKLTSFHVLPDESTPDISIYTSQTGQWVCENEDGVTPLKSLDIINHSRGKWQFFCAEPVESTISMVDEQPIRFSFFVSIDEEHVVLKIHHGDHIIDLGERVHHYLLLTLARQRLEDAQKGADQETQGWIDVDRVNDMLCLAPSHLNIQIFRIRKQFSAALPNFLSLPQVVERRVGDLRFGYSDFKILRGSTIEGNLCKGKAI